MGTLGRLGTMLGHLRRRNQHNTDNTLLLHVILLQLLRIRRQQQRPRIVVVPGTLRSARSPAETEPAQH